MTRVRFQRSTTIALILTAALASAALSASPAHAAVDPTEATAVFRQAQAICDRDQGRFWGRSLCGPMLLVDPTDRAVAANAADSGGALKRSGDVFVGVLPPTAIMSNTPIEWSGTRWTELLMPLEPKGVVPPGRSEAWLQVLLAHELFHRIQPGLGLTRNEARNQHLDTLDGRYLLQLEWRALAAALRAPGAGARDAAIADALMFRRERFRLFPAAPADEAALEINEGVPEYTGVKLGLKTRREQVDYALYDLSAFLAAPSFVRAFAYASGPSYGLLLDDADPQWRTRLGSGGGFGDLLAASMHLPDRPVEQLAAREALYDSDGLRASELSREQAREARSAALKARLVDGPVLVLPLHHVDYQFNPQTLIPLGAAGTVYPGIRLVSDFGVLTAPAGALLDPDMATARVSAVGVDPAAPKSPDWTLELKPGWTVVKGARPGDLTLQGPKP